MTEQNCDSCNQAVSTVHLTEIIKKKKKTTHLCVDCAKEKGVSYNSSFSVKDFLGGLAKKRAEEETSDESDYTSPEAIDRLLAPPQSYGNGYECCKQQIALAQELKDSRATIKQLWIERNRRSQLESHLVDLRDSLTAEVERLQDYCKELLEDAVLCEDADDFVRGLIDKALKAGITKDGHSLTSGSTDA